MNAKTKVHYNTISASLLALALAVSTATVNRVLAAEVPVPTLTAQGHQQARLQALAHRLDINPSQQAAWQGFATAVQSMREPVPTAESTETDAAAIVRLRANSANEHARRLSQLADAVGKLQTVLSPDQRQRFNEFAQKRWQHHRRHRVG
jgi:hypothetical protein